MRVLHLVNHLDTGEITDHLLRLMGEQKRAGHHVYVWGAHGNQYLDFKAVSEEVFETVPHSKSEFSLRLWFALPGLLSIVKEHSIDLMHAHTRATQALAQAASWWRHVPFITTAYKLYDRTWGRRLLPCWGKAVIAVSNEVKEDLIHTFPIHHLPPIEVVSLESADQVFDSVQRVYENVLKGP